MSLKCVSAASHWACTGWLGLSTAVGVAEAAKAAARVMFAVVSTLQQAEVEGSACVSLVTVGSQSALCGRGERSEVGLVMTAQPSVQRGSASFSHIRGRLLETCSGRG